MFVISQSDSYSWPVAVEFPVAGGKFKKETFDVDFKRLPQSRIKEIGGLIKRGEINDGEFCREIVLGWKGVVDDKGEELPFSEGARDRLLDVPLVAEAVVQAFLESMGGGAKRKN